MDVLLSFFMTWLGFVDNIIKFSFLNVSNKYCSLVLRHGARIPDGDDVLKLQVTFQNAGTIQSPTLHDV